MCDVTKRRFKCTCQTGFSGHRCQFPPFRSCKDAMVITKQSTNGIYNILDEQNISFPVYCDFSSEQGAAWTLIQSYSFENKARFKAKAFYLHDMPINQDAPEWNLYRLSMSRMKSIRRISTHWRGTCNFPTDGVDFRDYWRVSFESYDFLVGPQRHACRLSEFVNVHGIECSNCTVWLAQGSGHDLHLDSSLRCDLTGGVPDEDNFGFYFTTNPAFRCSSSMNSTTQYWIGRFQAVNGSQE